MFPISSEKSVELEAEAGSDHTTDQLVTALAEWARGAGARHVKSDRTGLSFRGGLMSYVTDWRTSTSRRLALSWNPLIPITSARVEVTQQGQRFLVTCRFRFVELLVLTIVLILLFAGIEEQPGRTIVGLGAKVWLIGLWIGVFFFGYFVSSYIVGTSLETVARETLGQEQEPDR